MQKTVSCATASAAWPASTRKAPTGSSTWMRPSSIAARMPASVAGAAMPTSTRSRTATPSPSIACAVATLRSPPGRSSSPMRRCSPFWKTAFMPRRTPTALCEAVRTTFPAARIATTCRCSGPCRSSRRCSAGVSDRAISRCTLCHTDENFVRYFYSHVTTRLHKARDSREVVVHVRHLPRGHRVCPASRPAGRRLELPGDLPRQSGPPGLLAGAGLPGLPRPEGQRPPDARPDRRPVLGPSATTSRRPAGRRTAMPPRRRPLPPSMSTPIAIPERIRWSLRWRCSSCSPRWASCCPF